MRLLSKFLWVLAFLAATFCWMVLFEHGFSMKGFSHGVKEEWQSLTELVTPKTEGQETKDTQANPPKSK